MKKIAYLTIISVLIIALSLTTAADKFIPIIENATVIYESREVLNKFLPKDDTYSIRLKFSVSNTNKITEIFIDPEQHQEDDYLPIDFSNKEDLDKLALFYLKPAVIKLKLPEKFSYWMEIPEELCK